MQTVTVIYDTSYLMNGGSIHLPDYGNRDLDDEIDFAGCDVYEAFMNAFDLLTDRHVIPTEVKQEIVRHLSSDEKASAARTARAMCAQIMACKGYQEISLADIAIIPNREVLLGPDSKTDQGLVALARRYAMEPEPGLIYVATNDGGIQAELSILYSQDRLPIFSAANDSEYKRAIYGLYVPLLQKVIKARTASVQAPSPPPVPAPKSIFARLFRNDRNA